LGYSAAIAAATRNAALVGLHVVGFWCCDSSLVIGCVLLICGAAIAICLACDWVAVLH